MTMDPITGWAFITRWGNSVLLLPIAAWIALSLWIDGERPFAWRWSWCFMSALLIVLATKLAFLGWGLGSRALDFTGISGHSTLASSVLPMLAWWLTESRSAIVRRRAIAAAVAFALIVGLSRIFLSAHSPSEVVSGFALGSLTAWAAIPRGASSAATKVASAVSRWSVAALLLLVATVSRVGDSDEAHGIVTRLALGLSGHSAVYTREML